MITLSAPGGMYEGDFETIAAARSEAAKILSSMMMVIDGEAKFHAVTPESMVEVELNGITYCYATQEQADADGDGAYAVQYSEVAR